MGGTLSAPSRTLYLDRIRVGLTVLVVLHHVAIVYGGSGDWYWREAANRSCLPLVLFNAVNQSYFMGFFFLLAGYFTPASFDAKGPARFLSDRFVRLGLPLGFYFFILSPLTVALARISAGNPFWAGWWQMFREREFGPGPLWFAEALLIFAVAYVLWRKVSPAPAAPKNRPGFSTLLFSALGIGAVSFLIRLVVPVGQNVLWLQLGYFAPYVLLFIAGALAQRGRWFDRLDGAYVLPWILIAGVAVAVLPVLIATRRELGSFSGGLTLNAAIYAGWDPLVGWGAMLGLLWLVRKYFSGPGRGAEWLARRAYGAYIVHPPVVVGLSLAAVGWTAPALMKFAVVGAGAAAGSFAVAALLLRLRPLQRIL